MARRYETVYIFDPALEEPAINERLERFHALLTKDAKGSITRSEEHTSELQSPCNLVCRLLLEKKKKNSNSLHNPHAFSSRYLPTGTRLLQSWTTTPLSAVPPMATNPETISTRL